MVKKILLAVTAIATVLVAGQVQAFCGGQVKVTNDCSGNAEGYASSCCPSGYRVQGVVYNDLKGEDGLNAMSAYCRKYKGNETTIPNQDQMQGGKGMVTLSCEPTEIVIAVGGADMPGKDKLDGVGIKCFNPTSKAERWVLPGGDIGTPNDVSEVRLPNRIQGIGWKKNHGNTDQTDCVNLSYKHEPIVKP